MHHLLARRGTTARGEIRHQYHHAIDIVPTILDVLGVEPPETIKGHTQSRFDGVSMRYSLDDRAAPSARDARSSTRCSAPAASGTTAGRPSPPTRRSAAGATSTTTSGSCTTSTSTAPSSHDLAAEHPEQAARAGQPVVRRGRRQRRVPARRPLRAGDHHDAAAAAARRHATATSTSPTPPRCPSRRRSTSATARSPSARWSTSPAPGAQGVLFAHGSPLRRPRPLRQGQPAALRQQLRRHAEQKVDATEDLPTGENLHPVGVVRQGRRGPARRRDRDPVAVPRRHARSARPASRPSPACSRSPARASASAATAAPASPTDYPGELPWRFTGGTINRVAVDVSGEPYVDLEREAAGHAGPRVATESAAAPFPVRQGRRGSRQRGPTRPSPTPAATSPQRPSLPFWAVRARCPTVMVLRRLPSDRTV